MGLINILSILGCVGLVVGYQNIHDHMSDEEIRQVFNTDRLDIPEYELIHIDQDFGSRVARSIANEKISLRAFGKDFDLILEPNDHVLYGSATPIFIASRDGDKWKYERKSFSSPLEIKSYVDQKQQASITIFKHENKTQMNGMIGDNIQIRSLPSSVHSMINGEPNVRSMRRLNYHAIIRLDNVFKNVTRNFWNNLFNFDRLFNRPSNNHEQAKPEENSDQQSSMEGSADITTKKPVTAEKTKPEPMPEPKPEPKPVPVPPKQPTDNKSAAAKSEICKFIEDQHLAYKKLYELYKNSTDEGIKKFGHVFSKFQDYVQKCMKNPQNYVNPAKISGLDNAMQNLVHLLKFDPLSIDLIPEVLTFEKDNFSKVENKTAYPQILVVVDYKTVKKFSANITEIALYQAAYWNAVDLRFRNLKNPKIRLNIAGLIIPKDEQAAEFFKEEDHELLRTLSHTSFADDRQNFTTKSYDVVVAIIERKFKGGDVAGWASDNGGPCGGERKGSALVVDGGGFSGVLTAAHEVGHLLGAYDEYDYRHFCTPYQKEYIMGKSTGQPNATNYNWSNCSQKQIKYYLSKEESLCFFNKPNVGSQYPKFLPSELMSRDELCAERFGPGYTQAGCYKSFCNFLWCHKYGVKNSIVGEPHTALDGTMCGENKMCFDGACMDLPE